MKPLRHLSSRVVVLAANDVDTDQIIPARFLTTTSREGLGRGLFAEWRFDAAGVPRPEFPLNAPEAQGAEILVAGSNFGCGSSREHAVWALAEHGYRALISTSFADIFRRNALKNGLVPVEVPADAHAALLGATGQTVTIDVEALCVTLPDGRQVPFALPPFARFCLLEGQDELQFLLSQSEAIARYEASLPATARVQEAH